MKQSRLEKQVFPGLQEAKELPTRSTYCVWFFYEGETREFAQLQQAFSGEEAEQQFLRTLMDASDDCPEKATVTRIEKLS